MMASTLSLRSGAAQPGELDNAIPHTYDSPLAGPASDTTGTIRSVPYSGSRSSGAQRQASAPLCDAIARVAREQFLRWRPGGGRALVETSPKASPILREYYRVGIGETRTDAQMQSAKFQAEHPWSAVFVSYVMRTAGAGSAFKYSAAHQTYIRVARRNRLNRNTANPFWAFRPTEVAPRVGDLVCVSRMNSGATYDNIGDAKTRATHCDVVTEVRPGQIWVIGGNVDQTVGRKSLKTLPDGRLSLAGKQCRIFAVIQCRPGRPSPGTPTPPSGRVPATLNARVSHVMERLVKYGYPVNGAAGLVGNLIAESGVLPNRLEGSQAASPMRAPDFTGQMRDFDPDQVRDRSVSQRTGPRAPGVGIAQWTSPDRRAGLFRHVFQGRQLGPAILFDLDAQVDYLVGELRRSYRTVNAALMSPGATVEHASDAVLLGFERPAAVIGRPRSDPVAREVIGRRRASSAFALRIYRAARPNQVN